MSGANRLMKEYREMQNQRKRVIDEKTEPIIYQPVNESDLYLWRASIVGPPETPFSNHRFNLSIIVPKSYPHTAPTVTFVTPVAHPNIHPKTGEICLDILKDAWSPIWNLESLCRAIIALLASGDASSPLNCDCGNLIRANDWRGYWNLARLTTIDLAERVRDDTISEADARQQWKKLKEEESKKK